MYAAAAGAKTVSFYALVGEATEVELEHVWVLPERIDAGVGRTLFDHAVKVAAVKNRGGPASRRLLPAHAGTPGRRRVYELDGRGRVLPLLAERTPNR